MSGESTSSKKPVERGVVVDMSSEAISARLREVSELHELGQSLATAKRCAPPVESRSDDAEKEPAAPSDAAR